MDAATGRIVNANIAEYLVPLNADVPDIQAVFVANDERNSNPLGVNGIGELPMVGVLRPSPMRCTIRRACGCARCRSAWRMC